MRGQINAQKLSVDPPETSFMALVSERHRGTSLGRPVPITTCIFLTTCGNSIKLQSRRYHRTVLPASSLAVFFISNVTIPQNVVCISNKCNVLWKNPEIILLFPESTTPKRTIAQDQSLRQVTYYIDRISGLQQFLGLCVHCQHWISWQRSKYTENCWNSKRPGAFRELLSYRSYLYYLRFSIYYYSRVHPPLIVINHSPSSETFHSIIFPTYYIYFPFSRSYLKRSHRVRLRYLLSFLTYTYLLNVPAVSLNYLQVFRATRAHKNTFPTTLSRPLTGQRYSRLSRSGSWP